MKRLGIFLFYDEDGIVSDHVLHLLRAFASHIGHLVFVANGGIDSASAARVTPFATTIIPRENIGFDVEGYRCGLLSIGFEKLDEYDEVVLFNYTCFGPMFDLSEMFGVMSRKDLDFWGQTEFRDDTTHFLQSYFIVTRRALHSSDEFVLYWREMPEIRSVQDSLEFHEWRFTRHFEDRGFRMEPYIRTEPGWTGNTSLVDIESMLDRRAPLIKYRAFNFPVDAIERRGGCDARTNLNIIRRRTDYPTRLIRDYIIARTDADSLLQNASSARLVPARQAATANTHPMPRCHAFIAVEESGHLDGLRAALGWINSECLTFVTSSSDLAGRLNALGHRVRKVAEPFSGMPLLACRDLIEQDVRDEDVVLNLSSFEGERNDYHYRAHLLQRYWMPLCRDAAAVSAIAAWFQEEPDIGVVFPPTRSLAGRRIMVEGPCPRASNWSFDTYPVEVAAAVGACHWPWRGNAAFAGRLLRTSSMLDRLEHYRQAVRPVEPLQHCGPEGLIPELARRSRYASGLLLSEEHAGSFVLRATAMERDLRQRLARQAERMSMQVKALRADLHRGMTAAPPAETDERDSRAQEAPGAANAVLLQRILPTALRMARRLLSNGDQVEMQQEATSDTEDAVFRSLEIASFVVGRIDAASLSDGTLTSRGWCYDAQTPLSILYVAVVMDGRVLAEFSPCLGHRPGIAAKLKLQLPHESCGFALKIPSIAEGVPESALQLVFVNDSLNKAMLVPFKIGSIGGRHTDIGTSKTPPPEP